MAKLSFTTLTLGLNKLQAGLIFITGQFGDESINWLALYSGPISNISSFQINTCQSNFVRGDTSLGEGTITALEYVWLNNGQNYTLVGNLFNGYGKIAIQVIASTTYFLSNSTVFSPPDANTITQSDCNVDSSVFTPWFSQTVTISNPLFMIALTHTFGAAVYTPFTPQSYLYSGVNSGSPPNTCTNLLQVGYYDVVGQKTTAGSTFTVVATNHDNENLPDQYSSAFHLYVLSGPYVNTASFVVSPSTSSATSSSSGKSVTTTGSRVSSTTGSNSVITSGIPATNSSSGKSVSTTGSRVSSTTESTSTYVSGSSSITIKISVLLLCVIFGGVMNFLF